MFKIYKKTLIVFQDMEFKTFKEIWKVGISISN